MRLRKLIFHLHLYLGLAVGLLVSLSGLTGTLLVFRKEIDARLEPGLYRRAPAPPGAVPLSAETVLERARRAAPGDAVQQLLPPLEPRRSWEIWLGSGRHLHLDPVSGAVLALRDPKETPTGFLFALHHELLAGERGETVVGVGGLALLLLGATGIFLWWPAPGKLRQGFTVRWGASWKRVNYDLHRVGGIAAVGLLSMVALTGAALVFAPFFTRAAYRLTGTEGPPPRPKSTPRPGAAPLSLDALLLRAEEALPGPVSRIAPAAKPDAPVAVRKRLPGEVHPNGMSFVYLDRYTGAVLRVEDARHASLAPRLLHLRYPLHIGSYGGVPTRLLHLLLGLAPPLLFGSGLLMWWNRTRARGRRREGPLRREPGAAPAEPAEPAFR